MKIYKNLQEAVKNREDVTILKINIKEENLPEEILNFTNLEELYIEGNCSNFPDLMQYWLKLKTISIRLPNFKGSLSSVFQLPTLQNIKIIETPLSMLLLPIGTPLTSLKFLTIKNCGLKSLPEEISLLPEVTEMNLSGNFLNTLPISLIYLKQMKRLNLDSNKFKEFPDFIQKISSLTHLSIDHNLFSADEKARIQREFHISPL